MLMESFAFASAVPVTYVTRFSDSHEVASARIIASIL